MKLYLVQHGEAASKDVDPQRPLTEKGRKDVAGTAAFLRKTDEKVGRIWHSGKRRAAETAEFIAKTIDFRRECEVQEGLSPNDPITGILEKVQQATSQGVSSLMIVGHLPFLQRLASFLLAGNETEEFIEFHQGGIICLELTQGSKGRLKWIIVPELAG